MYDLIDRFDLSNEEDLEILMEAKNSIKRDPIICVRYLEGLIREAAGKRGLCPVCLEELGTKKVAVNYGEVWGSEALQVETAKYCKECGWKI